MGQSGTVEQYFDGAAAALAIYKEAERMAAGLGPYEVRVGKSQISFRRRRGFAYLWRPGIYVRSPVPLVLSLALPRNLGSPRFKQVVHPSAGVWMHHLEVADAAELDAEVSGWLQEAYAAAG